MKKLNFSYTVRRCSRLGLVSLSYLWRRDQEDLLKEMIECSVNAVIIKVAALGLEPRHLGKSIGDMQSHLVKMVNIIRYLVTENFNLRSLFKN